jgi:trehalose/maltose hydrolase-like predicted phosphorylase
MARWHLRRADALADSAGGATMAETARWRRMADAIVDGYSAETGLYEQFAGFYRLEPTLITDLATPPVAADLLLGPDLVHRSQITKQADVVMLHHLVPDEVAPGSLGPNIDFYGPRCAHGSSLSPPIQAAVLARAGRADEALELFRIACRLDLDDLTRTTAGGLHLATMGGVWQALVYGFCGVRPCSDALRVDPHLPSAWDGVEVSVRYNGGRVRLRTTHDAVRVDAERPLAVRLGPDRRLLTLPAGPSTLSSGGGT